MENNVRIQDNSILTKVKELTENRMSVIETIIDIPAEHEKNVCGQFDSYLKKIERTLHVTIVARDGAIKLIGPNL